MGCIIRLLSSLRMQLKGTLGHVLTLMTGTMIAQGLVVLVSPILTRLFSPADMGTFSLFTSIIAFLSVLATGKYELAIVIPESDREGLQLTVLSLLLVTVFGIIIMPFLIIFHNEVAAALRNPEISLWLMILPVGLIISCAYNILFYWFNRQKQYSIISRNRIAQSTSVGIVSIIGGLVAKGPFGLIFGQIVGQLITVIGFLRFIRKDLYLIGKEITIDSIKVLAKKYKHFPQYLVPSHTINHVSMHLPTFLFTIFYGPSMVGFYALTHKVMRTPLTIIANSIGDVFRQKAAAEYREHGNCRKFYMRTLLGLIGVAVIPFSTLYFFSTSLFVFVFGPEWEIAGQFSRLMIFMMFIEFVINPLHNMFIIAGKQKQYLIWQVLLAVVTVSSILVGHMLFKNVETTIFIYSLGYSFAYLINMLWSYKFSLGK